MNKGQFKLGLNSLLGKLYREQENWRIDFVE